MKTLTLSTGAFDQTNTFKLVVPRQVKSKGNTVITVKLMQDYDKIGDGVFWAMSAGTALKSNYSVQDDEEQNRLSAETALTDGEIVLINGEEYKTAVNGDYSDAAVFHKL